MSAIAAFDVGATTTRVAIDHRGIRTYREHPTRTSTASDLIPHLAATLESTLESAGIGNTDIGAIGIGIPGTVDNHQGTVRLASNLHIGDVPLPLRAGLRSYIDVPITIENDVKTAALGLTGRFSDPGAGTLTYLSIGTGIASATVVNGSVLRGVHGSAGEIGQIQLERGGPSHHGSLPGALEAVAAGPVLAQDSEHPIEQLARAIHTLFMLFDPDVLVVGGGVTEVDGIRTQITEAVQHLRTTSRTTASLIDIERLEFLDPDERPGIEGAIHLVLQIPEMSGRSIRSAQIEGETA